MNQHHSTITRLLLALTLSALTLALLPLALQASPAASRFAPPRTVSTPSLTQPVTLSLQLRAKLHPALLKQLLTPTVEQTPVIVVMRARPNLQRADIASATSVEARRAALVSELQTTAARSQADVLALLDRAQQADRAAGIRSLWINNSIAARLDRDLIAALAARDDVAFIQPDQYRQWIDPEWLTAQQPVMRDPQAVEWNIARIRADRVWGALNVTGTGVVVANMDTGVDWQHPALHDNYRGSSPKGLANHLYSWFDATDLPTLYPVDGYGHGTHTMGILAGQNGIGVAPGAKWIAARIFDSNGFAYDSWIHVGFQWILAPGGDPAQAPDVLSNSWGSDYGANETFRPEVLLLNLAGIDTYFSNGNNGPGIYSVGSPASFPEAFGVGAVDDTEWLAYFSGRGPSPLGGLKPDVVAPGVDIVSSMPGGVYYPGSGTSMAAPHAAGIAALLRSAVPGLTISDTRQILTSTTVIVFTGTHPNNDWGWGRVDAFNAVLAVQHAGVISGQIKRADTGAPIAFADVTIESDLGSRAAAQADDAGRYAVYGAAAFYTVTYEAFGYAPHVLIHVPIVTDTVTVRDVKLSPLPVGWVTGRLTDLTGTQLLTGVLQVVNAPISIAVQGVYSLALPAGTHTLRASAIDHRSLTATVTLSAGQIITHSFALSDASRLLLIDSGRWYNVSEINYYRQALDDLGYPFTEWPIRDLATDVPTTQTLRAYPNVIWSAPLDSPGYVGAGSVISDYLWSGGHFILSGQDVAYWDGMWVFDPYFYEALMSDFAADDAATRRLTGTHAFAGQVISISGAGGADNQLTPDVIRSNHPPLTEQAFSYTPDQSGGQAVGWCRPYRAVVVPFGVEAVTDRAARSTFIERAFDVFARPLRRQVYALTPAAPQLIAPPGAWVTGTLELANYDEVAPVTFTLSASSAWPVNLTPAQISLQACESRSITVTAQVPDQTGRDVSQPLTVTAIPIGSPGPIVSATLNVKAPASILLVQDDRWYPVDAPYRSALAANGVSYDLWRVPTNWSGPEAVPALTQLEWYAQIIWFTGYDWYQSLTLYDAQLLQAYLAHDGRVLLSSQDVAVEPRVAAFVRDTLGVMTATLDVTITQIAGPQGSLFEGLAPQTVKMPYPRYILALAPQPDAQVELISEQGWPVALTPAIDPGKMLFMAFGFEGLPTAVQADVMNRSVGYLSRLGRSSVKADRAVVWPGETITLTIAARNDGLDPIQQAAFTFTLPSDFTYLGGDAPTWSGALAAGQAVTHDLILQAPQNSAAGTVLTLPVELRDTDQAIGFTRAAQIRLAGTDLALAYRPLVEKIRPGQVLTWELIARNTGALSATTYLTLNAPFDQIWITDTAVWSSGEIVTYSDRILWRGVLEANEEVTVSAQMTAPVALPARWLYGSAAAVNDYGVWQSGDYLLVQPLATFLPILRK